MTRPKPKLEVVAPDTRTDEEARVADQITTARRTIAQLENRLADPTGLQPETIRRYEQRIRVLNQTAERLNRTRDSETFDGAESPDTASTPAAVESKVQTGKRARAEDRLQDIGYSLNLLKSNGREPTAEDILRLGRKVIGSRIDQLFDWLEVNRTAKNASILQLLDESERLLLAKDPDYHEAMTAIDNAMKKGQIEIIDSLVEHIQSGNPKSLLEKKRTDAILAYAESLSYKRALGARLQDEFGEIPFHNRREIIPHFRALAERIAKNLHKKATDPITPEQLQMAKDFFQAQLRQTERQHQLLKEGVWQKAETERKKYNGIGGFFRGLVSGEAKSLAIEEANQQKKNRIWWEKTLAVVRELNQKIQSIRPADVAEPRQLGKPIKKSLDQISSAKDAYAALGVSPDASDSELKLALKKAQAAAHPDRTKPEDRDKAEEKFKRIRAAYEMILKNREQMRLLETAEIALREQGTIIFQDERDGVTYRILGIDQKRNRLLREYDEPTDPKQPKRSKKSGMKKDFHTLDHPWTWYYLKKSLTAPDSPPSPSGKTKKPDSEKQTSSLYPPANTPQLEAHINSAAERANRSSIDESASVEQKFKHINQILNGSMRKRRDGVIQFMDNSGRLYTRDQFLAAAEAKKWPLAIAVLQPDVLTAWWDAEVQELEKMTVQPRAKASGAATAIRSDVPETSVPETQTFDEQTRIEHDWVGSTEDVALFQDALKRLPIETFINVQLDLNNKKQRQQYLQEHRQKTNTDELGAVTKDIDELEQAQKQLPLDEASRSQILTLMERAGTVIEANREQFSAASLEEKIQLLERLGQSIGPAGRLYPLCLEWTMEEIRQKSKTLPDDQKESLFHSLKQITTELTQLYAARKDQSGTGYYAPEEQALLNRLQSSSDVLSDNLLDYAASREKIRKNPIHPDDVGIFGRLADVEHQISYIHGLRLQFPDIDLSALMSQPFASHHIENFRSYSAEQQIKLLTDIGAAMPERNCAPLILHLKIKDLPATLSNLPESAVENFAFALREILRHIRSEKNDPGQAETIQRVVEQVDAEIRRRKNQVEKNDKKRTSRANLPPLHLDEDRARQYNYASRVLEAAINNVPLTAEERGALLTDVGLRESVERYVQDDMPFERIRKDALIPAIEKRRAELLEAIGRETGLGVARLNPESGKPRGLFSIVRERTVSPADQRLSYIIRGMVGLPVVELSNKERVYREYRGLTKMKERLEDQIQQYEQSAA